ncbi:amino acid ABC transporter substrate-binding protein [Bacillus sp. 03113]|uniref:amino acid ABC transporter substrate-binding protein n=1 Tax=Bacillus sp. 03113 TaxID=2578211 RepID=UPI001144C8DD|nr:amino acid ABC transporter substrate-binding protein [Bacillus sp. 03113]
MKKSLSVFISLFLVLILALTGCTSGGNKASDKNESSGKSTASGKSLLDTIIKRDKLIGGITDASPGLGYVNSNGKNAGFDIDFVKAVAAGVLGDANKVQYRPLSATERFTAVQSGEVDVLIRQTTWTTNRDAEVGLNFGPVILYDGQGLMVRKDSGINSLKDFEGKRIGVQTGTTTELNLADTMRANGINYEPVVFDSGDAVIAAYQEGSIDAWTSDKSYLASQLSVMKNASDQKILNETLSKEPLAPSVKDGDDKWADAVSWIVYATIQAEEFGITSKNVDEFLKSDNPEIKRLLGKEGNLGEQLGLKNDFAYQVIKQVGNYGEIFDRNLGPNTTFNLERGLNDLYTKGGLMYSIPFR